MPTDLEDLVGFLHHGQTQIRQIAVENLLGYTKSNASIFKVSQLQPVKDLMLLTRDYAPISKNAMSMLINLSEDREILNCLVEDDNFLESLLSRITGQKENNANDIAILLANMAKSDKIIKILKLKRTVPKPLSSSDFAIDQLMDCFVKGAENRYNSAADYDYLSYLFADLAKFPKCRSYFTTPQARDGSIIPLTKVVVFTEHKSVIRRRGVASTIKNVAFDVESHARLTASTGDDAINILPYILLPLLGPEDYSAEDMDGMLEDLQLLEPDKEREKELDIMKTHIETLLLLTTTRGVRELLRSIKVYPIIREVHAHVDDEDVREVCDRLVQILMRDEEGEGGPEAIPTAEEIEDDEEDKIIDIA